MTRDETVEQMIERRLTRAFAMLETNYTCPRCNVPAYPTKFSHDRGWCPFCGMDPAVPGPAPTPKPFKGIL